MAHLRKTAKDIGFQSINALLSKYQPSLIASAIKQHGVYTWDGFDRYIEAKDDGDKGWVCWYDDTTLTYKLRHMSAEETPSGRTRSRAIALLELFYTYWKKAEKSGLPLGIANTVTIYIPKEHRHMYPQEPLTMQENADISEISVPLKLRAELAKFGWASADLPDFDTMQQGMATLVSPKPIATKQQKQHTAIMDAINSFGYDQLSIPPGGKAKIERECLKNKGLFTEHSFEHAWKTGKKATPKLWEVENPDQYKNN